MLKTAGGSRLWLADGTWIGASKRAHATRAPIRESGILPHVERDLLLFIGPTMSTRLSAFCGIGESTA
jgi:hypothetical protein